MKRSDKIIEISKALYQLHKSIGKAQKDAKNPFFNSEYSTLESVMAVAKEPLDANGLFITQTVISDDKGPTVETTVIHAETGEFITSSVPVFMGKMDMQGFGSAITYARRYGLAAILGIVQEDDDGNGAKKDDKKTPPGKSMDKMTEKELLEMVANCKNRDDVGKKANEFKVAMMAHAPSVSDKVKAALNKRYEDLGEA